MAEPILPESVTSEASGDFFPGAQAPRYLTIEAFAALTTLSESTIQRLIKSGKLKPFQPGGPRHRLLFAADALEQSPPVPTSGSVPTSTSKPTRPKRGPRPKWETGAQPSDHPS